ncbi:MAG: hypothetical protein ACSLFQ_11525 [Thermoanaerobaculia bacterium]
MGDFVDPPSRVVRPRCDLVPTAAGIEFLEYVDPQFAEGTKRETAWKYEPGSQEAK